VNNNKRW